MVHQTTGHRSPGFLRKGEEIVSYGSLGIFKCRNRF